MPTNLRPNNFASSYQNPLDPENNMNNSVETNSEFDNQESQTQDSQNIDFQPEASGAGSSVSKEQANLMDFILKSEEEIKRVTDEASEWKNKAFKYAADVENLQKHNQIQTQEVAKNTQKKLLKTLLPFLNTLQLAFSYLPQTEDPKIQKFFNTLKFSFNSLSSDLSASGITLIIPEIGSEVDPVTMSILNGQEVEGDLPVVKNVVSVGLKIGDFVITPASVMI